MAFTEPVTLKGPWVTLEPLRLEHAPEAQEAVQDGEVWRHWYTSVPAPDKVIAEIERRLHEQALGRWLPFALRDAQGRFVGMSSYLNIDPMNRRLEIGSTWLRASGQRTPINTNAKLLLLTHAFETLDCMAVEFRTHHLNQQSRAAIARLGAKQDGILRQHQRLPDGSLRDTVVFSVLDHEWPTVKIHLTHLLQGPGHARSGPC
jgi:RimJ/RimL family protein N-acetyltransferase